MAEKQKHRYLQFRLRSLFIAVALLALPLGWFGWQVRIVSERKAVMALLREKNLGLDGLPGDVPLDQYPHLPWYRLLLGDKTCAMVYLDRDAFSAEEIRRINDTFPEIKFVIAQDAGFRPYTASEREMMRRSANGTH